LPAFGVDIVVHGLNSLIYDDWEPQL